MEQLVQGARGEALCRACLRREDEALLAPISPEEQRGLDGMAHILDTVPWDYWKPGEQPAKLLDWLYLGDLEEAMDFEMLAKKGITAVVNLINWWELTARLPEVADISNVYASQGLEFLEADSEDRLFFDIVARSWPESEKFMERCRKNGQKVLVNCKAGHNRSACVCVCWLVVREGMTLLQATESVLERRGMILSNHGFRLQLVRLALSLGRLGQLPDKCDEMLPPRRITSMVSDSVSPEPEHRPLKQIITKKRLSLKYDHNSMDLSGTAASLGRRPLHSALLSPDMPGHLTQRTLKMELLACLYHRERSFLADYEYTSKTGMPLTSSPPTVIGSGFSGDVVLCKTRQRTAVGQNQETGIRCVKRFDLTVMGADRLEKLKNEAQIYLSLEHPHIARLFDVFEDQKEVALVMQYCSGGTLEHSIQSKGVYDEAEFQRVAVQMLLAMTYIHNMGIVHRDIKPRNWVYEADGRTIKLIDFGFSAKAYLSDAQTPGGKKSGELMGCMGTLGYLAPEVVQAGVSADAQYSEKCDIWSLGAVFYEMSAGHPAFHRDRGQCDGYTEEVVLREIETVTEETVQKLLHSVPSAARGFLQKCLTPDPNVRPSARQVLEDTYLSAARAALFRPDDALSISTVLDRFRQHGRLSKNSRAWMLAVARSPTYLPWKDFVQLRNTFKMFDSRGLSGTLKFETFKAVVMDEMALPGTAAKAFPWAVVMDEMALPGAAVKAVEEDIESIWTKICGKQESLSYCEFLAVLLPPIEDVFEDVDVANKEGQTPTNTPMLPTWRSDYIDDTSTQLAGSMTPSMTPAQTPSWPPMNEYFGFPCAVAQQWSPSEPVAAYLPLLRGRRRHWRVPIFNERVSIQEIVQEMNNNRLRWAVVSYESGKKAFLDYMDINQRLMELMGMAGRMTAAEAMQRVVAMPAGLVANCSGQSAFVPVTATTALRDVLRIVAKKTSKESGEGGSKDVRRVPIVSTDGEVLHVFSSNDFLDLALQFTGPSAAMKSQSAKTFDQRSTILQTAVMTTDPLAAALQIMGSQQITVVPATLRELCGDLGGVVASSIISVTDLKLVIMEKRYDVLDMRVDNFIGWRQQVMANVDEMLRRQRLQRFNVVSVDAGDSLYTLATRLLASKLHRIFLSSDEIARIVGVVSSRDILIEMLDQVL